MTKTYLDVRCGNETPTSLRSGYLLDTASREVSLHPWADATGYYSRIKNSFNEVDEIILSEKT